MPAELALQQPKPLRLSWAGAARLVLPATILVTLLAELLLAERKYAVFGGGFGASQTLDAPLELGAFFGVLLLCHSLFFYLLYRLVRRLHGRRRDSLWVPFNFAFFVGGGALAALAGKYQALAYFSDAMSFQIVRNLGGGSLVDALKYTLSEAGLMLLAGGGALLVYAASFLFLRKRWQSARLPDDGRIAARRLIVLFALIPFALVGAGRIADTRAALARFNSAMLFAVALDAATDLDRDGYSWFTYPVDSHPFDAGRHPFALDVPGDGIDQDGFGGDFVFAGAPSPAPSPVIAGARPNVVLIVLESTRADAIGRRIDGRPLTPVLDALAASGSAARRAYSHVGFTTNSLQSLFSGSLAPVDDRRSLVRDFLANGYEVAVFSGQAEDFGDTARLTGMRRGRIFVDGTMLKEERAFSFAAQGSVNIDGKILLREFDRRLGRREAWVRPHFLYVNLQSAHFPYYEPLMDRILAGEPIPRGEIGPGNRERVARTYWNAIAYNDRLIGALIARLRRLGALDNSIIVVTADHGESLFDDGFLGHGHALNEQQTRIPFIVSRPGVAMPEAVGLDDMRAIILRAAGADVAAAPSRPVFQYLGTLDRPGTIGEVDGSGRRILFNFFDETVWTSGTGRWIRYADLPPASAERRAADALIREWARQRWLRHLEGNGRG